ncbi:MAG: IPT/TIG domain-containing protein [Candidatus Marinimicrobia bacterium]|nr:IPT/TIG domain-containing protein [Candidatus Neomarinimicrobiota bacterium]
MKTLKNISTVLTVMGILVFTMIMSSCETEDPVSIYDPDVTGNATPVVTTVVPDSNYNASNITFSGVGVVRITGENFSATPDYNNVFFDGLPGEVISASATELRVRVPDVVGDSIEVRVAVQGSFHFGDYALPYKLTPAVKEIGGFDDLDQLYSLACDTSENLYVSSFGSPKIKILEVQPDSLKDVLFSTLTVSSTALKYGGNDMLYMTGGALVYSMNRLDGTYAVTDWFIFGSTDLTKDLDFVDSTQAFLGMNKASGLGYVMSLDLENTTIDTAYAYDSLSIAAVRIFDNDLYVAGSYKIDGVSQAGTVWKNSISGTTLGTKELVVDLGDYPDYASAQITAVTFSADGKMYLGLNSVSAILVYDNGILAPFYDPILSPPTADLTWGNGDYLYQLKTTRLNKINMVEAGAPYGGRY